MMRMMVMIKMMRRGRRTEDMMRMMVMIKIMRKRRRT